MATSNRRAGAAATSFAHLAGLGRVARADDETDEERKQREDKEQAAHDDECAKKEAAGDDTGESDDEKDERKDREDARKAARNAAKGNADDDGDGDDDSDRKDMRGESAESQAFRRGVSRCAAIFATNAAGRNPALAAQFAFDSELTRGEAIRALRSAVATVPRAERVSARADRNPDLGSGGSAAAGPANVQSMWDRAIGMAGVKLPGRA